MQGRDEAGLTDRRRFTVEMAMALLGGAAITVGCGGGGAGGGSPAAPSAPATPTPARPTPPPPPPGITFGDIANNHGHEVVVTDAELLAGGALSLTVGGAAHSHTVELSAEQVVRIRNKETVEVNSSEDVGLLGPHYHPIRFN